MAPPSRYRRLLIGFAKLAFAFLLVGWMTSSGRIDFTELKLFIEQPRILALSLIHYALFTVALGAWRWQMLLTALQIQMQHVRAALLSMIALFFNAAMPGAVGGDVVKAVYVVRAYPNAKKSSILLSLVADRIIGMVGLFSLGSIAIFSNLDELRRLPRLQPLAVMTVGCLCAFIVLFLFVTFAPQRMLNRLDSKLSGDVWVTRILRKMMHAGLIFRDSPWVVIKCWGLSMLIQSMVLFYYYVLANELSTDPISWRTLGTILPMGILAIALPIAPGGLGVGHMAFEQLFTMAGISGGANIFNVQVLGFLAISLIGIVPYLMLRGKQREVIGNELKAEQAL